MIYCIIQELKCRNMRKWQYMIYLANVLILKKNGKISINASIECKKFIIIDFKDNGIGIDKEDLDKIFEPFFTKKAKGTGLGLTICNELINLHGGIIDIKSKKGKGTTVTLKFPIKRKTEESQVIS